jgi:hypothetical protein
MNLTLTITQALAAALTGGPASTEVVFAVTYADATPGTTWATTTDATGAATWAFVAPTSAVATVTVSEVIATAVEVEAVPVPVA